MATVRAQIAAALTPLLPKAWRIIPYSTNLDAINGVVVMIRQTPIEKAPSNPQGGQLTTLTVTVIDPHVDPKRAEDALDDEVAELLFALLKVNFANWSRAERVVFGDFANAYDITLTTNTKPKED